MEGFQKRWYEDRSASIRIITDSEYHIVDYKPKINLYRVSIFNEENHWLEEFFFEVKK